MAAKKVSIKFFLLLLGVLGIVIPCDFAGAAQPRVLQYDFEGTIGPEWSTPFSTKIGNNKILGIFNDRNDKYLKGVQLTVNNIPPKANVALSFDIYFIGSWDSEGDLEDRWVLKTKEGTALLELTKFPARYREKDEEHPIGNVGFLKVGNRNLPYWITSEKVTAPFELTHNGSITFDFQGSLTGRKTEFWAIDNVRVEFQ